MFLNQAAQAYTPENIRNLQAQFSDPFTEQVIQQTQADIGRLGDQQQQALKDQAIGAGAFGGGRQAIGSAEIGRNVLDQQARTGAQLRSEGFNRALQTGLQTAGAQAGNLMNVANLQSALGTQDVNALLGIGGLLQGLVGRGKRRAAQAAAQAEHDRMRQQYAELDTSNLYANVENKYMNLENTFEDLTINKQQAEFERNMFERQQASIMSGLSAAAGGSGIAGLAQAMAQQSQIAGQRAAGSIGMQEYKNQILSATEASKIQRLERAGEAQAEAQRLAGAETARSLDYRKTTTQLGMSQQELAAANQAIATADAALYGGIGKVAGTVVSAGIGAIPSPS